MKYPERKISQGILSFTKEKLVTKIKKFRKLDFTLELGIYCYCGDNASNTDFFQSTCFKVSSNMAPKKNLRVTLIFHGRQCLPLIT